MNDNEKSIVIILIDRLKNIKDNELTLSKVLDRLSMISDLLGEYSDEMLKEKLINSLNKF